MLDDWKITHEEYALPNKAWKFIRENCFFGFMIPTEQGGNGFSLLLYTSDAAYDLTFVNFGSLRPI